MPTSSDGKNTGANSDVPRATVEPYPRTGVATAVMPTFVAAAPLTALKAKKPFASVVTASGSSFGWSGVNVVPSGETVKKSIKNPVLGVLCRLPATCVWVPKITLEMTG